MDENKLTRYARLVVNVGVNLQQNQILVINAPIECAAFVRTIAAEAFSSGAQDVVVSWGDELLARIRYEGGSRRLFSEFPEWRRKFYMDYYRKISTYEESKEEWKEDYTLTGIEKGNIVHKFIEHYRPRMDKEDLLKRVCISFSTNYSKSIYEELKPYINNYLEKYSEEYDQIYMEKSFYLKIKDSFITGVIDRINIKNGKAEIIDFKTNRLVNKNELIRIYTPQLQLYAYVVKEIMEINLDSAGIFFLENGEFAKVPIDERSLEENLSSIEEFMNFTSRNSDISNYIKNIDGCDYCKHRPICDLI